MYTLWVFLFIFYWLTFNDRSAPYIVSKITFWRFNRQYFKILKKIIELICFEGIHDFRIWVWNYRKSVIKWKLQANIDFWKRWKVLEFWSDFFQDWISWKTKFFLHFPEMSLHFEATFSRTAVREIPEKPSFSCIFQRNPWILKRLFPGLQSGTSLKNQVFLTFFRDVFEFWSDFFQDWISWKTKFFLHFPEKSWNFCHHDTRCPIMAIPCIVLFDISAAIANVVWSHSYNAILNFQKIKCLIFW